MRDALFSSLGCLLLMACGADATVGVDADDRSDAASGPVSIAFVSPTPGAVYARDQLGATGFVVADVEVALTVGGAPTRIVLTLDGEIVGETTGATTTVQLVAAGEATLVAIAYDDDRPAASAEVTIEVTAPPSGNCRDALALYQVNFDEAGPTPGIADPLIAQLPINGLAWRYVENDAPRATLLGDCPLLLSLAEAAPYLRRRGITEVADIGVYNYRCIGGGTPPNCPSGISQHAYARAIDIAGVTYGDGNEYASVNDDWVIDPDGQETCEAATEPGKDRLLHELICELKDAGIWNIVLTPNYNAAHRNHFHVDLTPGGDTIQRAVDPRGVPGLDAHATHVHSVAAPR